nr:MAG TPA: hypothetical protein [Caudoviricetes sp.]
MNIRYFYNVLFPIINKLFIDFYIVTIVKK